MPQDIESRLPMPVRLEPKATARSLALQVRHYFYALYNAADASFREYLASVGNKDSLTGKREFDRYKAVEMVKAAAKKAEDDLVVQAKEGDIYKYVSRLLRLNGQGLKIRRAEYKRITTQPAE